MVNNYRFILFSQDVTMVMKTKDPVHIILFDAVSSNVTDILTLIFPHSLALNTEACIKWL